MKKHTDLLQALFANIKAAGDRSHRARDTDKVAAIRAFMRSYQRALDDDLSPLVSVLSARQQGKSTGALLLATKRCLVYPGSHWVIIGLTRASVQRIYWDTLKGLSEAYELGLRFQEQRLIVTFPNGSKIHFFGADKVDEIEKLRGGRYHGAIIDECKSYPQLTLKVLIEDILGAALKGQAGQLYLIGTPGDLLAGEFYLATCSDPVRLERQRRWTNLPAGVATKDGLRAVWSFHLWGPQTNDVVFENPRTGRRFTMWDAFCEERALRGWDDSHPTWRREYLGQWVSGEGRLVYRYRSHVHDYDPVAGDHWGLPVDTNGKPWKTCLGADLGTKDGTAFVVWAWHEHIPGLWELYSEKRHTDGELRLSVGAVARWYKALEDEYGPFEGAVADQAGLGEMVLSTLAVEHGVYLEPAEKKTKVEHIELFNNDLDVGLIRTRRGSVLTEELCGNKWLERSLGTDRRLEDPSTPNDVCDAALYAFRWCNHRRARPASPRGPSAMTREWYAQMANDEFTKVLKQAQKSKDAGGLDKEWWS